MKHEILSIPVDYAKAGLQVSADPKLYTYILDTGIGFAAIAFTLIIMRRVRVVYYKCHPCIECLSVRLHGIGDLLPVTKLLKAWGVVVSNTNIENTS